MEKLVRLSSDVIRRCRRSLMRCTKGELFAIFITEGPHEYGEFAERYQDLLKHELVDRILSEEFALKVFSTKREPPFLVYLRQLCDSILKDDLYSDLSNCYVDIEGEFIEFLSEPIFIKYNNHEPEKVQKLIKHFLDCVSQNTSLTTLIHRLYVAHGGERKGDQRGLDILEAVHVLSSHLDDLEYLSYQIYLVVNETPDWRNFDAFLSEFCRKSVTYTRLQQLQAILTWMEWPKKVLLQAYNASGRCIPEKLTPDEGRDEFTMRSAMLNKLTKVESKSPILEFVEHLAYEAEKQRQFEVRDALRRWNRGRATEWGVLAELDELRDKVQHYEPPRPQYVLIKIDASVQNKQKYQIEAWLIDNKNKQVEGEGPYFEPTPVTLKGIPACLDEIRRRYGKYLYQNGGILFELLLPDRLLCDPVEQWPVNIGLGQKEKFGVEHKVVVRSLRRANDSEDVRSKWQRKWDEYENFRNARGADGQERLADTARRVWWVCKREDCEHNSFYTEVSNSPIVCLAPGFAPQPSHIFFYKMLSAGIPIALWLRPETKHPDDFVAFFESLLSSNNLQELPDLVWRKRREREATEESDHSGNHLSLLWDDPNRLPENFAREPGVALHYQRG